MANLTNNLSRHEFRCKCGNCEMEAVDFGLPLIIQNARDTFAEISGQNLTIYINSGNRCAAHNKTVGGASNSKHTLSLAADWWLLYPDGTRFYMRPVYDYMGDKYTDKYGLALYENNAGLTRIHTDTASRLWRKDYTK